MEANPFDQFDTPQMQPQMQQANPFDQFDTPQERGVLDSIGREAGLVARGVANGISALPGQIVDFPSHLVDATMGAIRDFQSPEDELVSREMSGQRIAPETQYPSEMAAQTINQGLSSAGVPVPETADERIRGDIYGALAGAKQFMGGANPGSALRANPGMQYASSAAGAASSGMVRENGGSEGAQIAAGLAGGIGAPVALESAYGLTKGAIKAVPAMIQPFTEGGREKIVGNALNRFANDPDAALANLKNYEEFIPDSPPTTGQAGGDYGLISVERGLRNSNPAAFADKYSAQNSARMGEVGGIAQNEKALTGAIEQRNNVTGQLRDAAFEGANPVNIDPLRIKIAEQLASPDNAGQTVQKALKWADGLVEGKTDPRALYAARKDIGFAMDGKLGGDSADFKLARKQLMELRGNIDSTLEQSAPGFGEYLSQYKTMSKPINQMETAQDILKRTTLAAPDAVTGEEILSQPKWKNVVAKNRSDLERVMTPEQMSKLDAVTKDLDRGASVNNANIRPAGSDTVQNLTTANLIGQVLGSNNINPLTQNIARPLAWMYRLPDQAMHDLLVDAMLDPKMASRLMEKATPDHVVKIGEALKKRVIAYPVGAAIGTDTTIQNTQQ